LKLYQVSKYLTLTHHYCILSAFILSQRFFDKLSASDQDLVRAIAADASEQHISVTLDSEGASLESLKGKGMEIFQAPNIQEFRDKVVPVHQAAIERIGAEIVSLAEAAE